MTAKEAAEVLDGQAVWADDAYAAGIAEGRRQMKEKAKVVVPGAHDETFRHLAGLGFTVSDEMRIAVVAALAAAARAIEAIPAGKDET